MRSSLALVVAALAVFTVAAPSKADKPGVSKRWDLAGKCNGTSCKVGLINYSCDSGSCAGPKGGDGAYCYYHNLIKIVCPGGSV